MSRDGRDYDVIVVGAGHNALVSAAYLAQAGHRVGVFEKRPVVGGAIATEEIVPGYQFDLGGSAHILIRLTPIVEELGLESHGLEYLDVDPLFFAPYPDGDSLFIHRDADRTAHELEQKYPGEGEAYRRLLEDWRPFAERVKEVFLDSPSPWNLGKRFVFSRLFGKEWKRALRTIFSPYGEVARQYFSEEKVITPLVWMAAQSGPPPNEPMSAPFLLWHPLYHEGGMARPRGGSGMLAVALRRAIEAAGGEVHVSAPVSEILVEDGAATGIRVAGDGTGSGIYTARAVLSGAHALVTLGQLLPEDQRPKGLDRLRVGNGFGAVLRLALDAPVEYSAHPGAEARTGLQLLCRDTAQIDRAYGDFMRREPSSDPPIVAMTFSAVDDSLAPPGGEVLWLWGQYYPYELAEGLGSWDDIGEREADRLLDQFERYAPGTREKVVGRLFEHPLYLERELGLPRGNVMHLEMSFDQMFMLRPGPGLSDYRSHLKGLYLTGASTHPGGGIMGASGRNAARTLLKDLSKRKV